jgi:hypothetical protein
MCFNFKKKRNVVSIKELTWISLSLDEPKELINLFLEREITENKLGLSCEICLFSYYPGYSQLFYIFCKSVWILFLYEFCAKVAGS